jgi:ankyrin repeat protein
LAKYPAWRDYLFHGRHHRRVDFGLIFDLSDKINTKNDRGDTALHLAVENRKNVVVKLFIKSGADINVTDANAESTQAKRD